MALGKFLKGIARDVKKAAKGSKEYQKSKKGPISKAIKQVSGDVKKAVKGSKGYQKRKKGPISKVIKQVTKDVKTAVKGKKATPKKEAPQSFGKAFSSARGKGEKTFTWKGKSYTTKRADDVKKKKVAKVAKKKEKAPKPKIDVRDRVKAIAKRKPARKMNALEKETRAKVGDRYKGSVTKDKPSPRIPAEKEIVAVKQLGGMVQPPTAPSIQPSQTSYDKGGKVEGNPYGWPSRDARGKK